MKKILFLILLSFTLIFSSNCNTDVDETTPEDTTPTDTTTTDGATDPEGTDSTSDGSTSSSDSSGTTTTNTNLCDVPYKCNSATKYFGDLKREYKLEKCKSSTGSFSLQKDCSTVTNSKGYACKCEDSSTHARCAWAGETCLGIKYTW